jgi:hypothetical protein
MIQGFSSMLMASFVMSRSAVFCCRTVALGGSLMFPRRGSVCFNYMVVFVY